MSANQSNLTVFMCAGVKVYGNKGKERYYGYGRMKLDA